MKPTNSPTNSNPRKITIKVAFGPLFPTTNIFSWVGIGFTWETEPWVLTFFSQKYLLFGRG